MNAASISRTDFIGEENAGDSDSDTNSEGIPEYYQPLSPLDYGDDSNEPPNFNGYQIHNSINPHNSLSNGHFFQAAAAENGVRSLNLSEDQDQDQERENEQEEEEERRRALESESAMRRAIEEDESRRNAPLTAENAMRVMEAMRGISFNPGFTPDWATDVPEDRWVDQLRRIRQPPPSHSAA